MHILCSIIIFLCVVRQVELQLSISVAYVACAGYLTLCAFQTGFSFPEDEDEFGVSKDAKDLIQRSEIVLKLSLD